MDKTTLLPRNILGSIKTWLDKPEIIVLLGARQVGKSSIMKLLMQDMASDEYVYLDLEGTYNLEIVSSTDRFLAYLKTQNLHSKKTIKVFIDEFQYLPEPAKFLKLIHDHHREIKLIISVSSSSDIRKKFTDALTGRKTIFAIYPLSFAEFMLFKGSPYRRNKTLIDLSKILQHFDIAKDLHILTPKILPVLDDFIRDHIYLSKMPGHVFALYVSGRSMEPEIFDGDLVIVNPAVKELEKGDLGVFRFADETNIVRSDRRERGRRVHRHRQSHLQDHQV